MCDLLITNANALHMQMHHSVSPHTLILYIHQLLVSTHAHTHTPSLTQNTHTSRQYQTHLLQQVQEQLHALVVKWWALSSATGAHGGIVDHYRCVCFCFCFTISLLFYYGFIFLGMCVCIDVASQ